MDSATTGVSEAVVAAATAAVSAAEHTITAATAAVSTAAAVSAGGFQ